MHALTDEGLVRHEDNSVWLMTTQPVFGGRTLVLEQSLDQLLTLSGSALGSVIARSILIIIGLTLVLLGYASWLSWRITRLQRAVNASIDKDGRITGTVPASKSRDELGQLQNHFAQMADRLHGYNRYLESFSKRLSHELKTPLTSIKGFMGALERDLVHNEVQMAKDKLQVINKNVSRLNVLVKDLLELSRIDASEDASKEDIEVEPFTEDTIRELKPLWQGRGHAIVTEYKTPVVKANRVMLGQVMSNLLENAVKYCDSDGQIRISWETNDGGTFLKVIDNGPGVSEEHLSRLFERFYRVQKGKTKSGVVDTGLGLSIVRNCMIKHQGRVDVESLPGQGTTFTCYFPK